jgi:SsrA-binding protein
MGDGEIHNRKAGRDYTVLDSCEAGIELRGTEVKSLRAGEANFNDAFARVERGEAWLYHMHIAPYDKGNRENHDPRRLRRLLLHKSEIRRLHQEVALAGRTLVPLKGYFKKNRFKILLGICKGKTHGDRRETLKKKESQREVDRELSRQIRGR